MKEYPIGYDVVVNADDCDIDEIDRKFEMMSAECAKEMAKNYGAPNAKYDKEE